MRQFTPQQKQEIFSNALNRVNNIQLLFNKWIENPNWMTTIEGTKKKNTSWLRDKCKGLSIHFFISQAVNSIYRPPLKFEVCDVPDYFPEIENKTLYENFSIEEAIEFFDKRVTPTVG